MLVNDGIIVFCLELAVLTCVSHPRGGGKKKGPTPDMGSRRSTGVNSNYNHLRRLRNVVVHFFIVLLVFVVLVGCDNGSSSDEDNRELNINLDA